MTAISMMNAAIETSNEASIDQTHRKPQVMMDGKRYDLSNLCRKRKSSKKRKKKTRKSVRKTQSQPILSEKVSVEVMCRQDPMISKSQLGHIERTKQRSNLSHQSQRLPTLLMDGEKYNLSNLCIPL
jgi:hypothetical protein